MGSNPVIVVMSATRPLFLRKQTFVPILLCRGSARTGREQLQQTIRAVAGYSITSSARASTLAGRSRPSALAVLRLMTSSFKLDVRPGTPRKSPKLWHATWGSPQPV